MCLDCRSLSFLLMHHQDAIPILERMVDRLRTRAGLADACLHYVDKIREDNSRLSKIIEYMSGGNADMVPALVSAFIQLSEMEKAINNNH
jgi:hypothetical protein